MNRIAIFHGAGSPFEIVYVPTPKPRAGEILVRVACVTLCTSDLHTHAGRRHGPIPTVLGHEVLGQIEAFGETAPRVDSRGAELRPGDRITWSVAASCGRCFFCADDLPQKCESLFKYGHEKISESRPLVGGLADRMLLLPGTACFRVPDSLSDTEAAPVNCATATVSGLLRHAGLAVNPRCSVLIFGAGTLGLTAAAMAASAGVSTVIVADPDERRRERSRAFGATHAVAAEPQAIREAISPRGADVVLELAGTASAVEASITHARTGGTIVLAGTVLPTPAIPVTPERMVRNMLTIKGVHNYAPVDLGAAIDFLDGAGRAYPFGELITKVFPLQEVDAAFAHAHANPGRRVAVTPD